MNFSVPQLLGLATIAAVILAVLWLVLRKQPRPVWLFALALVAVGLGYLATTNAPTDLARTIFGEPS